MLEQWYLFSFSAPNTQSLLRSPFNCGDILHIKILTQNTVTVNSFSNEIRNFPYACRTFSVKLTKSLSSLKLLSSLVQNTADQPFLTQQVSDVIEIPRARYVVVQTYTKGIHPWVITMMHLAISSKNMEHSQAKVPIQLADFLASFPVLSVYALFHVFHNSYP